MRDGRWLALPFDVFWYHQTRGFRLIRVEVNSGMPCAAAHRDGDAEAMIEVRIGSWSSIV